GWNFLHITFYLFNLYSQFDLRPPYLGCALCLNFCSPFSKYFAHVFFNCPASIGSINLNKPDVLIVTRRRTSVPPSFDTNVKDWVGRRAMPLWASITSFWFGTNSITFMSSCFLPIKFTSSKNVEPTAAGPLRSLTRGTSVLQSGMLLMSEM